MENASKALIIAGGVLIGVLILSLMVYLFLSFGANSKEIYDRIEDNQLLQFNANFNVYEGRNNLTIHQVVSVASLAKENNEKYPNRADHQVQVILNNMGSYSSNNFQDTDIKVMQKLVDENTQVDINGEINVTFKCTKVEYNDIGRVSSITFKLN